MDDTNGLEGQWIPLVDSNDQTPLSSDQLDEMARNFQPVTEGDHIPVRFGRPDGKGPVIAKISSLKRDGSALSGKLTKVDPRFETLYKAKKLGSRVGRSLSFEQRPEDGSAKMTGYGFSPPAIGSGSHMVTHAATDAFLNDLMQKHRDGETFQFSAAHSGRVEIVMDGSRFYRSSSGPFRFERNSEQLNDLARTRESERNISFGEALSQVAAENPHLTRPDWMGISLEEPKRPSGDPNGEKLTNLARERQHAKSISFGEALSQVATENPQLTRRW